MKATLSRSFAVLFVVLLSFSILAIFNAKQVKATTQSDITINEDGNITPPTEGITKTQNTYTINKDFNNTISIKKSNIILKGNHHTLYGNRDDDTTGIQIHSKAKNVTIKDLNIQGFAIGIYLESSQTTISEVQISDGYSGIKMENAFNNTITNNIFKNGYRGIRVNDSGNNIINQNIILNNEVQGILLISDFNNIITKNIIKGNKEGIYLQGVTQTIYLNIFLNNLHHAEANEWHPLHRMNFLPKGVHNWDNGTFGNYWSEFNGTDFNGDGISEKPYNIHTILYENIDHYPILDPAKVIPEVKDFQLPTPPPTPSPTSSPKPTDAEFPILIVASTIIIICSIAVLTYIIRTKRRS